MEKKIPTYKIRVNPDDETTGVYCVSLVDQPAIEVDWITLSKEIVEFEFSINKDKQMLFGPLLIPGKLILRRDNKGNDYNIVFDEETIQIIADKYNENKMGDIFNFQHSDQKVNAVLLQNWITGSTDKSQDYGFKLPQGTWFAGIKVKDEEFWLNDVKTGKVKGFSVEIMAESELIKMTTEEVEKNKINLMEIKTKDGLVFEGDLKVSADILEVKEDGSKVAPADGKYTLEDGSVITVLGGKITEHNPEEKLNDEEEMEVDPNAPVEEPSDANSIIDELRQVIADLASRVDALENVETVEDQSNVEEQEYRKSHLTKYEELEARVEELSKVAGAPSITIKSDLQLKKEERENEVITKLHTFRKMNK